MMRTMPQLPPNVQAPGTYLIQPNFFASVSREAAAAAMLSEVTDPIDTLAWKEAYHDLSRACDRLHAMITRARGVPASLKAAIVQAQQTGIAPMTPPAPAGPNPAVAPSQPALKPPQPGDDSSSAGAKP